MTKQPTYDAAVVGLGLIGAAALRHLAELGLSTVGIGPPEPAEWGSHPGVFASHYDSGRITRVLDDRYEWAELARRSMAAYPDLVARTGIAFHHPVGVLHATSDNRLVAETQAVGTALGVDFETGTAAELVTGPYRLPRSLTALAEHGEAGHVDPRAMLRAQLAAAGDSGATVVAAEVRGIEERADRIALRLADESSVVAGHVVVSAGAYTGALLPDLALTVKTETTILARLDQPVADGLRDAPALLYDIDHPDADAVYVVPPVRYPDGQYYLKMGCNLSTDRYLAGPSDMGAWMRSYAVEAHRSLMIDVLRSFLPDVPIVDFLMKPCLVTYTAHGLPYVDQVGSRLYVAAGGNGSAAKSSDALGVMAAALVGGHRTDSPPTGPFRAVRSKP
jgi:sarcosine oxidase